MISLNDMRWKWKSSKDTSKRNIDLWMDAKDVRKWDILLYDVSKQGFLCNIKISWFGRDVGSCFIHYIKMLHQIKNHIIL